MRLSIPVVTPAINGLNLMLPLEPWATAFFGALLMHGLGQGNGSLLFRLIEQQDRCFVGRILGAEELIVDLVQKDFTGGPKLINRFAPANEIAR